MVDKNLKNDSVHVRNALPEELDEVSQLLQAAYRQYERFMPSEAWQAYLEDILNVRSRLTLAELIVDELNSKLVGTVTLYLKNSHPSETRWPEGWASIRLLAVHPKYRRQGISHVLMDECIRRCRERGISTIGLRTTEIMDIARRMYERMGFTRIPEFDFHPSQEVVIAAYHLNLKRP